MVSISYSINFIDQFRKKILIDAVLTARTIIVNRNKQTCLIIPFQFPKMLEATSFYSLPLLFLRFCEITYPDMFSYLGVRTYDEQK